MGRVYVRKTDRQSWSHENMKRAIQDIQSNGSSVNSAAKKFGIPEATLRRYMKKDPDEVVRVMAYISY